MRGGGEGARGILFGEKILEIFCNIVLHFRLFLSYAISLIIPSYNVDSLVAEMTCHFGRL